MKPLWLLLSLPLVLGSGCSLSVGTLDSREERTAFGVHRETITSTRFDSLAPSRPLFNGKDLTGWVVMNGGEWVVEKGELVGRNGVDWSTNPEKSGSWLRTENDYGDFILELEYAVNEKGNSGVFIRSALEKNPAFTGHEIQILDDAGKEPKKYSTGSLYDVVAPSRIMSKPPGQWNRLRVEARGARVIVTLNDAQIVDYPTARSLRGYIGLQNHDDKAVIRYRNIKLREL